MTCCPRKVRFANRREARNVPKRFGKIYLCKICGYYHIGHKPKRKTIAQRRSEIWKDSIRPMLDLVEKLCGVGV